LDVNVVEAAGIEPATLKTTSKDKVKMSVAILVLYEFRTFHFRGDLS
jgi:hypothetical protein